MIERYLRRIGASHSGAVGPRSLAALHLAHLRTVPFENLDIHAGVPIVLDEARILDKVVNRRRGGFCYELNSAFAWLLRQLGYDVTLLSAQVHGADGWGIEFDHMTLRVDLEEPWLVDVGFGDSFLTPLRLLADLEQPGGNGSYRLRRTEERWILERQKEPDGSFEPQYRFTLNPRELDEFAPGCTYHQAPPSHFATATLCSLATAQGRITLRPEKLIRTEDGLKTEEPVDHDDAWRRHLEREFGIDPQGLARRAKTTET